MQVPTSAANFVELEALRWENRKLSDAKAVAETEVQIVVHLCIMQASCKASESWLEQYRGACSAGPAIDIRLKIPVPGMSSLLTADLCWQFQEFPQTKCVKSRNAGGCSSAWLCR